jgi:hypothetical protein
VELVGGGGPVGRGGGGGEIPKYTFSSANRRLQKLNLPLWPKRTIYRFGCAKTHYLPFWLCQNGAVRFCNAPKISLG